MEWTLDSFDALIKYPETSAEIVSYFGDASKLAVQGLLGTDLGLQISDEEGNTDPSAFLTYATTKDSVDHCTSGLKKLSNDERGAILAATVAQVSLEVARLSTILGGTTIPLSRKRINCLGPPVDMETDAIRAALQQKVIDVDTITHILKTYPNLKLSKPLSIIVNKMTTIRPGTSKPEPSEPPKPEEKGYYTYTPPRICDAEKHPQLKEANKKERTDEEKQHTADVRKAYENYMNIMEKGRGRGFKRGMRNRGGKSRINKVYKK